MIARLVMVLAALMMSLSMTAAEKIVVTPRGNGGGGASCTANGKTDWSNACDIPLGVALGVL